MTPTILFRPDLAVDTEYAIASEYFPITSSRTSGLMQNAQVIGRYSVLPFYRELEVDLYNIGSSLINSYTQHRYIANFDYYHDVVNFTPHTWFQLEDVPKDGGPFVLKGRTNSRKDRWNRLMYAATYADVAEMWCELAADPFIGPQGVIVRQYVPLHVLETGINGTPFANEWRLFWYQTSLLATGFYWTCAEHRGSLDVDGLALAQTVAAHVSPHVNFFVTDIAQTADGQWILIEVNDAQMSGLSEVDPHELYRNLRSALSGHGPTHQWHK